VRVRGRQPCPAGGSGRVRQRVVVSDISDFEKAKNRVVNSRVCISENACVTISVTLLSVCGLPLRSAVMPSASGRVVLGMGDCLTSPQLITRGPATHASLPHFRMGAVCCTDSPHVRLQATAHPPSPAAAPGVSRWVVLEAEASSQLGSRKCTGAVWT
jgi:hypothetical protein